MEAKVYWLKVYLRNRGGDIKRAAQIISNLSSPHQEDQQPIMHGLDTIMRIPEPGGEAEESPWVTEGPREQDKRNSFTLTSHLPQVSTASCQEARWTCGVSSGKREHRGVSGCPSILEHFSGSPLGSRLARISGTIYRVRPVRTR